jgi:uncharacterized membrane protein
MMRCGRTAHRAGHRLPAPDVRHRVLRPELRLTRREFDAEITEQHPDERVAWKTENGTHQAGVVTFHRLDNARTRVTLQLDHDPEGFVEKAGDALGIVQHRVKGDLENFRKFIEERGSEEGGWRGDVDAAPQTR